jgi:hypothetical protein
MVKMEMVSIVRRGMGGLGPPNATYRVGDPFGYPGVPFGYREVQIGDDEPQTVRQTTEGDIVGGEGVPPLRAHPADGPTGKGETPSPRLGDGAAASAGSHRQAALDDATLQDPQSTQGGLGLGVLAVSLGGMAVLVAAVSVLILVRAKKA